MTGAGTINKTLTEEVRDSLRTKLLSGKFAIGAQIPTESAIAKNHGVSVTTVRRAVDHLVHEGLLSRRQGSGTYVADRSGVRNKRIGLVVPERNCSPFYMQMAAGMEPILRDNGFSSTLFVAEDVDSFHRAVKESKKWLDGLIVCGYMINREVLDREEVSYVVAGGEERLSVDFGCTKKVMVNFKSYELLIRRKQ